MPREVEPENFSAGIQSPEPITEGSLSPELISELKDVSDAMSEESICSRCGGSKQSRDRGVKPLPPSRLICSCRPKLDKIKQEEENIPLRDCPETENSSAGIQSPEPITEGSLSPELISELKDVSDALSEESICSRCGGSKQRDRGVKPLPPSRLICSCRPKLEKIQQEEENIPLRDCPETDAAVEEIAQIKETAAEDQSPTISTDPSPGDPPSEEIPAQQEQTTGCREDIRDQEEDESVDSNWFTFTGIAIIVVMVIITVGITLTLIFGESSLGTTNSTSTNSTIDED